ncbi:unnamed protein product, partial [Hymenolepis diminuta]
MKVAKDARPTIGVIIMMNTALIREMKIRRLSERDVGERSKRLYQTTLEALPTVKRRRFSCQTAGKGTKGFRYSRNEEDHVKQSSTRDMLKISALLVPQNYANRHTNSSRAPHPVQNLCSFE